MSEILQFSYTNPALHHLHALMKSNSQHIFALMHVIAVMQNCWHESFTALSVCLQFLLEHYNWQQIV